MRIYVVVCNSNLCVIYEYGASDLLLCVFFDEKEGVFTVNTSSCIEEALIIQLKNCYHAIYFTKH